MIDPIGVCLAFDDPTLEPAPDWTRLDTSSLVASYQIDRGRQFELDRTDTGRATVQINDRDGVLDPTNPSGPYFGKLEPLLQAAIALYNPVADTWTTIFRGYVQDFDYKVHPSQHVTQLTLSLVDAFEILAAIEMQPGQFGDTPPVSAAGQVFFDNANVDDRLIQILGNAGWPTALQVIFSGNVLLYESAYSPGETVLTALQEAVDAEFPGVGNLYVDKTGRVTFHGRLAKFFPEDVSSEHGVEWDWHQWKAGDGTAVALSPSDTAQIRALAFNRGLSKIINQASATPPQSAETTPAQVQGQLVQDLTSIGTYGIRSWSAPDLITKMGLLDSSDAWTETKRFAQYAVDNYATPRTRISELVFRSMRPDDPRAAANWALLCGAEISDAMNVKAAMSGGGGFTDSLTDGNDFFIEGLHYDVKPLTGDYADVTMSPDLSPQAYYASNPFPTS